MAESGGAATVPSNGGDKRLVVIAVDASHTAEHAFDWYVTHLHRKYNEVLIVHCIEVHPPHTTPSIFIKPEVFEREFAKAKENAHGIEEKFMKRLKDSGISGKFEMIPGKAGEAVVQVANERKAELILTGTRGVGTIRRTILGSVSDYVVHHAHCAVVTVRKNVPI